MKRVVIGLVVATAAVSAIAAYATTQHGEFECAATVPGGCKGKVSEIFHNAYDNTCYSVKASCKGNYVGTNWWVYVSPRSLRVETDPGVDPACEAEVTDLEGVRGVKASCKTASVNETCGDGKGSKSSAKASVKRRADLCAPCCEKPDKATGSCDGACPECVVDEDCDVDADPCTDTLCEAGKCVHPLVGCP